MPDFRYYSGIDFSPYLIHYGRSKRDGAKVGSGRYPLGSGDRPRADTRVVEAKKRMNIRDEAEYDNFFKDSDRLDSYNRQISSRQSKIEDLEKLPRFSNIKKVRARINDPEGEEYAAGRLYNCQNCATAFDMVERGYDVCASPRPNGSNVEDIERFFKGGKIKAVGSQSMSKKYISKYNEAKAKSDRNEDVEDSLNQMYEQLYKDRKNAIDRFESQCLSQGNGARGIMIVGWMHDEDPSNRTNSYHAMNYKVERGNVKIYDVQSSRDWKQNGGVPKGDLYYSIDPREVYVMRTDNLEPSEEVVEAVYSNKRRK